MSLKVWVWEFMRSERGGLLARNRTIAPVDYQRWLIPPCALAIHLCIGMAYGFSVFWLPLSRAIGVTNPIVCQNLTLLQAMTTTTCDWRVSDLTWTYSLFFVVLGVSAAVWGGWLERVGPRKAGVVAACCWAGGMAIGAVGVSIHQLWLLWLGAGLIGGIGLGIGYISPVSTLIKWFPDKRGMATGMAIMGFGGGALVGSPLADLLMKHFAGAAGVGVWQTMLVLAAIYLVAMLAGAFGYRVPPANWTPSGWTAPPRAAMSTGTYVDLKDAHRTPQFWLIWTILLLNVSASIGIIGIASPMVQEIFAGRLISQPDLTFLQFDDVQKAAAAAVGAGFVGLISLFNIGGRFFWASISDRLGRKSTYGIMLALGAALYGTIAPWSAGNAVLPVFVLSFAFIASMYGGGFATVPAYLADTFGTRFVGAIHGRLLTAWSVAGVLGPLIVTTMRDARVAEGAPRASIYPPIFLVLAGLLVLGFVANIFVRPVAARLRVDTPDLASSDSVSADVSAQGVAITPRRSGLAVLLAWAAVGLPLLWGLWTTATKASALFATW
ncbi:OFA family MFS transporter [Sphingomonas prati]|uniref:MFS family permease n=1 Tax=Sphingomonas prati TaxID=1843237 RepID=A0A7W9BUI6_9SPHN|nr:OFA family MFS transporter [Sphingomonas prati]MBB5730364.1 MFS family permease [Sphingomonas prati]